MKGKFSHSHNIGAGIDILFNPGPLTEDLDEILERVKDGIYQLIRLPQTRMPVDWRDQTFEAVYGDIARVILENDQDNVVFQMPNSWKSESEFEDTTDWFTMAYSQARYTYPICLPFDINERYICVHIRRGDLLPGQVFEHLGYRMLSDQFYEIMIRMVCRLVDLHNWNLLILTDGLNGNAVSDKGDLSRWELKLDDLQFKEISIKTAGPFLEDFHAMVSSDLLIGSRSGMSHLAANLGSGIKLMPEFWNSYRFAHSVIEFSGTEGDVEAKSELVKKLLNGASYND
jgi:hypothetical protein